MGTEKIILCLVIFNMICLFAICIITDIRIKNVICSLKDIKDNQFDAEQVMALYAKIVN